jgi:hypothetical protein
MISERPLNGAERKVGETPVRQFGKKSFTALKIEKMPIP